jgi:hypothetical protein
MLLKSKVRITSRDRRRLYPAVLTVMKVVDRQLMLSICRVPMVHPVLAAIIIIRPVK